MTVVVIGILHQFCSTRAVVAQLRAVGLDVRDEDAARLSPFVRHHTNMDLPGGMRTLRDPDAAE